MISVLILTYNEAENLANCIASVPWKDDVHVLDSYSSDTTCSIAKDAGATVHLRTFTGYAEQRNFGLALAFENDWIVCLDADERMTPELAREIELQISNAPQDLAMLLVRRKDMFLGRWLRHSSGYPTWFPRAFRRGRVQVRREINEEYYHEGVARKLASHLVHFPFNKGVEWWFERHNRYSTIEASVLLQERRSRPINVAEIFCNDSVKRRIALKQLLYRMPLRPFVVFIYLYVFRLGFLDGVAGLHFASMRMAYEIMINAKLEACKIGHA